MDIMSNILNDVNKFIELTNSFKAGDRLVSCDTEVEFIKFHEDDPTRYLFYGKVLKSDKYNVGEVKRNFYTHKFNKALHP